MFKEFEHFLPVPVICVADFEATLLSDIPRTDNVYQIHEANSFASLVHSDLPEEILNAHGISTSLHVHMSKEVGEDFLIHLRELA